MKKTIIILLIATSFFIFLITRTMAQKAKVVSAYSYLKYGELDKAKDAIDSASANEKSNIMAKTWYYRGKVYHAIYESKDDNYKNLHNNPLNEAYLAYVKIMEFDDKDKYIEDVKKRLHVCAIQFVNKGVKEYTGNRYDDALTSFENSISINKMPMFNTTDTLSVYNAALACEKLKQYEKAKGYYKELIELKWGGSKIFSFLANIYKTENDTSGGFEIIQQGRAQYPDDNNLVIEELNYYILTGKTQEAVNSLKIAIEKDKGNYNLYYALGSMYDQLDDFGNGENAYIKGLELAESKYNNSLKQYTESNGTQEEDEFKKQLEKIHNEYFSILYNFGALYFNEGVNQIKEVSEIKDNVKYANEKKEAEKIMIKALPYLEKALELNPTDKNTLISLKDLYARTGNDDKWQEMKERLEN
ncbi:MAG: hypothetical protein ABII90_14330 [Bacteroidota bacterium]